MDKLKNTTPANKKRRDWKEQVVGLLEALLINAQIADSTEETHGKLLSRFIALRQNLDEILDEYIQILTNKELRSLSSHVQNEAYNAILTFLILGVLSIITMACAIMTLKYYILAPTMELAATAKTLASITSKAK